MKQAVVGINEIMGRHRNAVAPHGVLPQRKPPLVRLRIMRPGLRHGWMKSGVIPGITAQQPFHHGIDNLEIGNGSGNMRIKTLRFRIIAHDQHSFLLRPFHAGTRIASGEQQHHTEHHEQAHGGILSGFLPPRKASPQEIQPPRRGPRNLPGNPSLRHCRASCRSVHGRPVLWTFLSRQGGGSSPEPNQQRARNTSRGKNRPPQDIFTKTVQKRRLRAGKPGQTRRLSSPASDA